MFEQTLDTLNDVAVSTERSKEFHFRFVIGSGQSKRTLYARNADQARQACGIDVEANKREAMAQAKPTDRQCKYLIHLGVHQNQAEAICEECTRLEVYDLITHIITLQYEVADGAAEGYLDDGGAVDETSSTCDVPTKSGSPCRNKAGKCQFHS